MQANGVYLLGMMIFPIKTKIADDEAAATNLQVCFVNLSILPLTLHYFTLKNFSMTVY